MKNQFYYLIICLLLLNCNQDDIFEKDRNLNDPPNPVVSLKISSENNLPMELANNFIWGVNGHTISQSAYRQSPIEVQKNLLKEFQFSYYRLDVGTEPDGKIGNLGYPEGEMNARFLELAGSLNQDNIKILPVLKFSNFDLNNTEQELFNQGKQQGIGFVTNYGQYFNHIAIGNERDGTVIKSAHYNGTSIDHYDLDKFNKVAAYLAGVSNGIKNVNSNINIIINCGDPNHYGYYQLIDQYSRYNIKYDIVGWHWYSNMVNISGAIDNYQKPIWITEANRKAGSIGNNGQILQENDVNRMINELHTQKKIKAFFIYELYNEPAFDDGIGFEKPDEAYYGLIKWKEKYTEFEYKPVAEVLKFKIEESEQGYQDYVYQLYNRINMGSPDLEGLNYWTNKFTISKNKISLLNNFLPEKSYNLFVNEQYNTLLEKNGDLEGNSYWTNRMRNGLSRENLIMEFCNSSEFWNKSGQTNEGFVKRLYSKLLNREADDNGLSFWVSKLNKGVSKTNLVNDFIRENEYLKKFINSQYIKLNDRNGDDSGIDYWSHRMRNGLSQQGLIIEFLVSKEFWDKSIIKGYERRTSYPFSYD